jgi:uncharacterized Rmd1/YagE family protein
MIIENQAKSLDTPHLRYLHLRALLLGTRIEIRTLEYGEIVARAPLTLRIGTSGLIVVFRFGAAVLCGLTLQEEAAFINTISPLINNPFTKPENEELEIEINSGHMEHIGANGKLSLREASIERIQVVATVLAKSTVLAHYESNVANAFDWVEKLAERLGRGRSPARGKELLREIGGVLLIQARMVGRVEITEKPEITWDQAELDHLYEHLAKEYELIDRNLALSRKLELIALTAETYLDLLHNRQTIRVEWYIVVLIVAEIILTLYEMFLTH